MACRDRMERRGTWSAHAQREWIPAHGALELMRALEHRGASSRVERIDGTATTAI